jgi:ADP-ribose pyrophosphatase YjhB (NUDIX family)
VAQGAEVVVVHAREEPPQWWDAAVFLAGPTPRAPDVPSWRPEAVRLLRAAWPGPGRLAVFVPEDPGGGMHGTWPDQVVWEDRQLHRADVVAFWVPRDLTTLPGFTTNVEFGRWQDSGKAVLGAPPEAPGTRYLRHYAAAPVDTLPHLVDAVLARLDPPARRRGAERDVPLHLWHRPEFQSWYASERAAGNELRAARPAWSTWPVWVWCLAVEMWVAAEDRVKSNEVLVLRPDTVAVVLYRAGQALTGAAPTGYAAGQALTGAAPTGYAATPGDTEVVLVREYRAAARTDGGYVWELPGGSGPGTPREQAAAEVVEETGLALAPERLRAHGSRQVTGTLATYHAHLYSAELTDQELDRLRAAPPQGVAEAGERTVVEVTTLRRILAERLVDWATLGQLAQVLAGGDPGGPPP